MAHHKKLRGLEGVTDFLKLIFASAYIKNVKPLSAILVAPVSSGKTISIKQFSQNKQILTTTDSTAYGIIEKYGRQLEQEEIKHIVMPDFLNSLVRRKTSVDTLLLFINSSSEDGLFPSKTFSFEIKNFIKPFGWVLCLTDEGYKSKRKQLVGIGFESRFFIIHHKYSSEIIKEILNNIINEDKFEIPILKIKGLKNKKEIKGNVEIFKKLVIFSELLSINGKTEVLRIQRKLQTLCKSSAHLRGDNSVKQIDLNNVEKLLKMLKSS